MHEVSQTDDRLLLVATDRMSTFGHVLETPNPDKGRMLTQLTTRTSPPPRWPL